MAPVPVVLVGSFHEELGRNLITIAWCGVGCSDPEIISVSIRPERYSYRMIEESGCFTVNIPTADMAGQVNLCGTVSGRDVDKFAESGLTPVPGKKVPAPLVGECPLNIECRLVEIKPLGVHHIFFGEVACKNCDAELVSNGGIDLGGLKLLAYVDGKYRVIGDEVTGLDSRNGK